MTLEEQAKSIQSRDDFIAFVQSMQQDLQNNANAWTNPTLDRFLEALAAWVADMDGYYLNQGAAPPQNVPWRIVGDFLMGARLYE